MRRRMRGDKEHFGGFLRGRKQWGNALTREGDFFSVLSHSSRQQYLHDSTRRNPRSGGLQQGECAQPLLAGPLPHSLFCLMAAVHGDVCSLFAPRRDVCSAQRCLQPARLFAPCRDACNTWRCLQCLRIFAACRGHSCMQGWWWCMGIFVAHSDACSLWGCLQCLEVFAVHRDVCIIQGCLRHADTFTALCRTQRHRQQLFSLAPTLCLSFPLPETKQSTGAIGTSASCTIACQPFIPQLNPPASTPKMPLCKEGGCKAQPAGEGCQQQGDV